MSDARAGAARRPLDGIRVLDLTRLLPGAVATMLLGDFGADVIKVEEPGAGDPARLMRIGSKRSGAVFFATGRNKRSVAINLKSDEGKQVFLRLAERADVVIEGFRPGVMDRLGLGYEVLRQRNKRLVYCALTGYGQNGPYKSEAGHDINYISIAGVLGLNADTGSGPVIPGVQMADLAGGSLQAVIGVLLALAARESTGEGQMVDVSMTDGALALMIVPLVSMLEGRRPEPGREGLSGKYACYHLYETKDGRWLAVGALEPKFWANVCRVTEREDLIPDQFAEGERQAECISALKDRFRQRSSSEWIDAFSGVDSCVTLVKTPDEALADPQIAARNLLVEIEHPSAGRLKQLGPWIRLSSTPGAVDLPPPQLGEHTREVLTAHGVQESDIERLIREGVIEEESTECGGRRSTEY
jgi:crotonobetainyl-CoA:carnitine CoA-transferase CaiB-like acyl-CoA transferase